MTNKYELGKMLKNLPIGEKSPIIDLQEDNKNTVCQIGIMKEKQTSFVIFEIEDLKIKHPLIEIMENVGNEEVESIFEDPFKIKMMIPTTMKQKKFITLTIHMNPEISKTELGSSKLGHIITMFNTIRFPNIDWDIMETTSNFDNVVGL